MLPVCVAARFRAHVDLLLCDYQMVYFNSHLENLLANISH